MSGDPLSRPLIEIARELRDRRATARELVDAGFPGTSASASGCTPIRSGHRSRPAPSPTRPMLHSPLAFRPGLSRGSRSR